MQPVPVLTLILLLQQPFGPPAPVTRRPPAAHPAAPPCGTAPTDADSVTVCARRDPDQRLGPRLEDEPAPSEGVWFRLPGGGRAGVAAAQSNVGGFTAPGAKATLRLSFGRGKRD